MAGAEFIDHSEEFIRAKDLAVKQAFYDICRQLERNAKLHIEDDPRRVHTGRLRASIGAVPEGDGNSAYVGTNVEYAPFVHEGTTKMRANPFLKKAVAEHIDDYKRTFEDYLKGIE